MSIRHLTAMAALLAFFVAAPAVRAQRVISTVPKRSGDADGRSRPARRVVRPGARVRLKETGQEEADAGQPRVLKVVGPHHRSSRHGHRRRFGRSRRVKHRFSLHHYPRYSFGFDYGYPYYGYGGYYRYGYGGYYPTTRVYYYPYTYYYPTYRRYVTLETPTVGGAARTTGAAPYGAAEGEEPARNFESSLAPLLGGPERVTAAFALGEARLAGGEFGGAAAAFEQALEEDPNDPATRVALALALSGDGRYEGAAHMLRRGLAALP
ncbi:MAG: tetratricopeptide repeat protein, partial [Planctomycetota bacterium]